jgi:hypothetical protein
VVQNHKKSYYDVATEEELWQWIEGPLFGAFYSDDDEEFPQPLLGTNHLIGAIQLRQARVGPTACPLIAQAGMGLRPYECTARWTLEREKKPEAEYDGDLIGGQCAGNETTCENWNEVWDSYWLTEDQEQSKMKGSPLLIPSFFGFSASNNYGYQGYAVRLPQQKALANCMVCRLKGDIECIHRCNEDQGLCGDRANAVLATCVAKEVTPCGAVTLGVHAGATCENSVDEEVRPCTTADNATEANATTCPAAECTFAAAVSKSQEDCEEVSSFGAACIYVPAVDTTAEGCARAATGTATCSTADEAIVADTSTCPATDCAFTPYVAAPGTPGCNGAPAITGVSGCTAKCAGLAFIADLNICTGCTIEGAVIDKTNVGGLEATATLCSAYDQCGDTSVPFIDIYTRMFTVTFTLYNANDFDTDDPRGTPKLETYTAGLDWVVRGFHELPLHLPTPLLLRT